MVVCRVSNKASNPLLLRSSICSLNPPVVPRPRIGGGGNTATNPSSMLEKAPFNLPAIAPALSSGDVRSVKSVSGRNTMPLFGLLVKPFTDRPGNAMVFATPSVSSAICCISLTTSTVRSRLAASGSWATATRYCLSCCGMKPPGTALNRPPAKTVNPTYTTPTMAL